MKPIACALRTTGSARAPFLKLCSRSETLAPRGSRPKPLQTRTRSLCSLDGGRPLTVSPQSATAVGPARETLHVSSRFAKELQPTGPLARSVLPGHRNRHPPPDPVGGVSAQVPGMIDPGLVSKRPHGTQPLDQGRVTAHEHRLGPRPDQLEAFQPLQEVAHRTSNLRNNEVRWKHRLERNVIHDVA